MASTASTRQTITSGPESRSGVYQTSPGLLRRRLVGPWGEGLAQYIALRVGDGTRGRAAYGSLLRMLSALPPEELLEAPGPKARLYRLARSIAETERAMPAPRRLSSLPWRDVSGTRGAAIDRLRAELSSSDAELLELRHARELSVIEIACVLEEPEDEVELALDTAEARARRIAADHAPDPLAPRAALYVEAFALESGWSAEGEELPEPDAVPLEPGAIIGGRYAIVERVGVGAFGDVYRAEDTEVPGHRVALKLLRQPSLSESSRQSALRELRMNAAVFHPSLVQFKDHGWFEQRLWFVMPWYEGETLEQRMRRDPLDRDEARRLFTQLARALSALHAVGIRHQDIKPDNILLTRLPGQDELLPVLIDLGVAADEQEGLLGGTPLYFAPEVAARFAKAGEGREVEHEVSSAADVFALALALRNALEPETQEDVPAGAIGAFIEQRAKEAPPPPEARSLRYLERAWARWLSVDPLERPSAAELAEELAILTAPEERRARRVRLLRWLVPMLMALAGVFGAVVHHLDQRAETRAREAERAEGAAADARAELVASDARRREIEEGHAALLARYEQGRMSRRELASRLATAEGQLRYERAELARAAASRDELRGQLGARTAERDASRARALELTSELEASGAALAQRERELGAERARARDLGAELASERDVRARVESELVEAVGARERTEGELARVRAHVDRLAELMRAPAEETPETPEPSATEPAAEATVAH